MCMWPERFEEPIPDMQDIKRIKGTSEYIRKATVPVKAALQDTTTLYFKEPLLKKFAKVVTKDSDAMRGEQLMFRTYNQIKTIQLTKAKTKKNVETDPSVIIKEAIENTRPLMLLEKVMVGGMKYLVPKPISERRSYFEGMRWIHRTARDGRDNPRWVWRCKNPDEPVPRSTPMHEALADEILDAYANTGRAVAKKLDYHRICEQNRAYAQFRRTL